MLQTLAGGALSFGMFALTPARPAHATFLPSIGASPKLTSPKLFGFQERLLPTTPVFEARSRILKSWTNIDAGTDVNRPGTDSTPGAGTRLRQLRDMLTGLRGVAPERQIRSINENVNKVPYVPDERRYRQNDLWAVPSDFLTGGGDCEEYAVTKYTSLRWLGFNSERLRVVLGRLPAERLYHAILTVNMDHEILVLDNRLPNVRSQEEASRYFVPILSMNESRYWLHYR